MPWVLVVLIRFLIPLVIFRYALLGAVLAVIADNLDVVILDFLKISDFGPYNRVDKFLDNYFYFILGYVAMSWKSKIVKKTAVFLLVYRTIGFLLYEVSDMRILLFLFPNLFIFYVMYYMIAKKILRREPIKTIQGNLLVCFLLLIPKLGQEYMLHVAKFPIYEVISRLWS